MAYRFLSKKIERERNLVEYSVSTLINRSLVSPTQFLLTTVCSHYCRMNALKVKLNCSENPLKQIREALGMSQREFADVIGAAQVSIFRWETGKTTPVLSFAQIKALQRQLWKLGLDFEDLPDQF